MTDYRDLLEVTDEDLDSPTIEIERKLYYLPTELVHLLENALDALPTQEPIQAWVKLVEIWLERKHPGMTFRGAQEYDRDLNLAVYRDNTEAISHFSLAKLSEQRGWMRNPDPLYEIGIGSFASLVLSQEDELDALGDQLFGERNWQRTKRWFADE